MTKLENIVRGICGDVANLGAPQKVLDEVTLVVLANLWPSEIVKHNQEVYDDTANEYANNKHTKDVINELLSFIAMLPDDARVLDVGCGAGRDSLFMATADSQFRASLMQRAKDGVSTLDRFCVPRKTFRVTGIDQSVKLLEVARAQADLLRQDQKLTYQSQPLFSLEDMHNIDPQTFGGYAGVWSCTSLFTHTPRHYLEPAMESVARVLDQKGLFFTSYTNGNVDGKYDKLLLSKTGRIKYFSQPNPEEIAKLALRHGMTLKAQLFGDFELEGKVIKENLFVSQFFKKT